MNTLVALPFVAAVAFALGWYIRGRGFQGVKNDLANAEKEISNLKAQLNPPAPVVG
jgi:uncharacterized membrane protein YciS (DUF1049 family)